MVGGGCLTQVHGQEGLWRQNADDLRHGRNTLIGGHGGDRTGCLLLIAQQLGAGRSAICTTARAGIEIGAIRKGQRVMDVRLAGLRHFYTFNRF